ncbi:MAG: AAA family ATPase [Clostridiales bacterium]|nr:AAA family ATPase [Clostridiales bacterium]
MSDRDNKDEIISMQLDLIRHMTEQNVRRLSEDIWGVSDRKKSAEESELPKRKPDKNAGQAVTDGAQNEDRTESTAFSPNTGKVNAETSPAENIDDLTAELDGYIGLGKVKDEVRSLINMAKVLKMRREYGLPVTDMSLHMVFSGNPGTGKTMIARFMARVYHSIGLLSKGHLVETDRSGLVAGYIGQTAVKTQAVLKSALGGVLFIDEAYSLTTGAENDFGGEAVDTLLKFMEDNRDDIVVIVAGYTELMEDFVNFNPGLRSRFNKYIEFSDYTPEEMCEIFLLQCKSGLYEAGDDALSLVKEYFESRIFDSEEFGNARGVRNTFEKVLAQQANRLADLKDADRDELVKIKREDVNTALF